jgi:VCBS repeat-containing protein
VTLNSDGSVSYDPNGQFDHLGNDTVATDTFTYAISDRHGATATAIVTLSITGANDPPVARDDRFTTNEDAVLRGNVLLDNGNGRDTDPDVNDKLSVTGFDALSRLGARIAVRPDGTFDYDPSIAPKIQALGAGETEDDRFTYTIGDGYGGTDTASVSITVHGLNDVPMASDDFGDFIATDENAVLSIAKDVFLSNDSDPDANDSLLFTAIDASQTRGSVEIRGDTIIYDPRGAFNVLRVGDTAVDSFTYWIRDNFGAETSATAFITIHGQGTPWTVADFEENVPGHSAPFGWDTVGTVRAVTRYPDLNESPFKRQPIDPPEGNWMARLDADPWPMGHLRNFFGIAEAAKNHLMVDSVDNSTAVNGAAMKQALAVEAGDIVSFRWAFDALDSVNGAFAGANDFALFVANGDAFRIMDVRAQMGLTNTPFGAIEGIAFYRAPASGHLTIGFGVFDDGSDLDPGLATDSVLFVDHIQVNREAPSDGYSVVASLSNDHFQTYAASHGT